jgi:hypothetical protein
LNAGSAGRNVRRHGASGISRAPTSAPNLNPVIQPGMTPCRAHSPWHDLRVGPRRGPVGRRRGRCARRSERRATARLRAFALHALRYTRKFHPHPTMLEWRLHEGQGRHELDVRERGYRVSVLAHEHAHPRNRCYRGVEPRFERASPHSACTLRPTRARRPARLDCSLDLGATPALSAAPRPLLFGAISRVACHERACAATDLREQEPSVGRAATRPRLPQVEALGRRQREASGMQDVEPVAHGRRRLGHWITPLAAVSSPA